MLACIGGWGGGGVESRLVTTSVGITKKKADPPSSVLLAEVGKGSRE